MISALWLLLVIPASVAFGFGLCALFGENTQADICANCQYNCSTCTRNKKETN